MPPLSPRSNSDGETRRHLLDAKAPADLKHSQDLTPTPLSDESDAVRPDREPELQPQPNIASQMVASDARARISALEEELKRKDIDHVRQLASLVRASGATALPPELTARSLGSFLKRKKLRKLQLYRSVASSALFDEKWYIANNPDVASKKMDAVLHYLYYGSKQHRPPGPNFDTKSYLEENPDVGSDGFDALTYFLSRGHREGRPLKRLAAHTVESQLETFLQSNVSLSLAVPFQYLSQSSPARRPGAAQPTMSDEHPIAALVHIFHEELAAEMRRYLERIPSRVDVFISTADSEKKVKIEKTFANWAMGAVDVRIVANRGRDLAPILVRFKDVIKSYDLTLHMHSKRSSHSPDSFYGVGIYLKPYSAMSPQSRASWTPFDKIQTLGMVGASHFGAIRNFVSWGTQFRESTRTRR